MKDSFILYNSFYEPIKSLSDEQLGKLFRAVFDYTTNGNVTEDNNILIAFMFIKNQIDLDTKKWEEERKKRSEAGRLGGINRAKNQKQKLSSKSKQCLEVLRSGKQSQANQGDNVNVNVNVNNKKENNKKKKFGEFNNVLLTEEEYTKLVNNNLLFYIDKLSAYLESTGKRYKSHYATILSWSRKEKQDNNKNEETKLTKIGNGAFIIGG